MQIPLDRSEHPLEYKRKHLDSRFLYIRGEKKYHIKAQIIIIMAEDGYIYLDI